MSRKNFLTYCGHSLAKGLELHYPVFLELSWDATGKMSYVEERKKCFHLFVCVFFLFLPFTNTEH